MAACAGWRADGQTIVRGARVRDKLLLRSFDSGLFLLPADWKTIRFLPPLNEKRREPNITLEIIKSTLKEMGV